MMMMKGTNAYFYFTRNPNIPVRNEIRIVLNMISNKLYQLMNMMYPELLVTSTESFPAVIFIETKNRFGYLLLIHPKNMAEPSELLQLDDFFEIIFQVTHFIN